MEEHQTRQCAGTPQAPNNPTNHQASFRGVPQQMDNVILCSFSSFLNNLSISWNLVWRSYHLIGHTCFCKFIRLEWQRHWSFHISSNTVVLQINKITPDYTKMTYMVIFKLVCLWWCNWHCVSCYAYSGYNRGPCTRKFVILLLSSQILRQLSKMGPHLLSPTLYEPCSWRSRYIN